MRLDPQRYREREGMFGVGLGNREDKLIAICSDFWGGFNSCITKPFKLRTGIRRRST